MRRFLMAGVLACVVSSVAFAGIIHSTDVAPPEPPPSALTPAETNIATDNALTRSSVSILLIVINAVV